MEQAGTLATAGTAAKEGKVLARFLRQVREHRVFLAFGVAMLLVGNGLDLALSGSAASLNPLLLLGSFVFFWPMLLPALLPMLFFRLAVFERPASPGRALVQSVRKFLTADGRFLTGFVMMLAIFAFISGFSKLKAAIPVVQPFAWDAAFDQWDLALHFGYRPWELLQPVLGYGPVTMLINVNYHFWFLTLSMFWLHFAFQERPGFFRTRVIIAYMLTWSIGGVALAMVFSSAGPCYFGNLGLGYDPYAGLMDYLRTTNESWPVWALAIQDTLWSNFAASNGADITKGISAMPSMHNGQVLLLVIATWGMHPLVRAAAIGHGVLVFLGSVHLGWHYAVDAYAAFAIAGLAWVAAGHIARAIEGTETIPQAAARR